MYRYFATKFSFVLFFIFYFIHITRRSMLYILFKKKPFHCLVLYNLNVILTYSFFCLHYVFFFVVLVFFFLLSSIFNEAKWICSSAFSGGILPMAGRQRGVACFACGDVAGRWSSAVTTRSIHLSVNASILCPFSRNIFHFGLQWRRPTQLFIQQKTSHEGNAANLAFCLQRSAKSDSSTWLEGGRKKNRNLLVYCQDSKAATRWILYMSSLKLYAWWE